MNNAEIEQLKLLVEEKYGKGLNTTTDFESFSVDLHYKAQLDLSASTLKRLWGYVSDSHKPRVGTLDVLARYLGHADYRAFVRWLKTSTRFNSSFIHADQLVSNALVVGDEVEIGWNPNRLIRLRYLGEQPGDIVELETGRVIGQHRGLWFHTIGQRKGLGLGGGPWFVVKKDVAKNILFVSHGYDPATAYKKDFRIHDFDFLTEGITALPERATFKIRHTPEYHPATIETTQSPSTKQSASGKRRSVKDGRNGQDYLS